MKDSYIFRYIIIIVVIVSVLLSGAALLLQPYQQDNINNEKKMMILKAAGIKDATTESFDNYCSKMIVIDPQGNVTDEATNDYTKCKAFKINLKDELYNKANGKDFSLPMFIINDNGRQVNVVPLQGAGLWGPIWGYLGLSADYQTVVGAVFDHKSETPGLGAEITTEKFQRQFPGKVIFQDGQFVSINVQKGGIAVLPEDVQRHSVDAISGGTITSHGINDMIKNVLESYLPYINK
ncbi:MAG: NADH:ubiquinone reductase (Na(+)-transporting) subunit C [Bacteroidales bacterium]|nr:NADH:ubiquinone reductase (Na(+)-transporting) subunit C [Bacteroidales bacterium]